MKRIAFFGPLSPENTGIADYDEAILPLLREHYEVDVFTAHAFNKNAFPHWEFYQHHKQSPYDLSLYQMGNNAKFHGYIFGYAFQFPGAVVFHDYCIHHSRAAMLIDQKLFSDYRAELAATYPEDAQKIADSVISFAAGNLLYFTYPFFDVLLKSSLAAATHTDAGTEMLRKYETPVFKIPHLELPGATPFDEDPFPGKFVIGSFGFVTRAKRLSPVLEAFATLRRYYPNLLYVIAGEVERPFELQAELKRFGIEDSVVVTGYLEDRSFLQHMDRADIILNLRYPSAGEMSGTLVRALASSKPVLISRLPHLEEIPDSAVLRVRPDHETEDLITHISELIENTPKRKSLGIAARKYVDQHHRPKQALEKYCEMIETAMERKPTYRPPELPIHLQSGHNLMRSYLQKHAFPGQASTLLDRIVPP